jgi:hypothetical protein
MHDISPPLLAELTLLWIEVDAAAYESTDIQPDEILWIRIANKQYSVRSAYQMQFDGAMESMFPVKVWQIWAPLRCKFFTWLMLQNRI